MDITYQKQNKKPKNDALIADWNRRIAFFKTYIWNKGIKILAWTLKKK